MQRSGGAVIHMRNTSVEYLFGSEAIEVYPREPYADECCDFLESLSNAIRKNEQVKQYPDVMTFAYWIRKANILRLKKEYQEGINFDKVLKIGRGLVFHIAPSNVPINFAYTLVFGLLSGNSNIVKVSSKRFSQIEQVCRIMNQVADEEKFQWVKKQNAVVVYDRKDEEYTEKFSSICDARVIWGGDYTIEQVRKHQLQARSIEITFADRYSFAVMSSTAMLEITESEIESLAEQFYNDTYLMDQNACSSPHLVCWLGEADKIRQASLRFWQALYNVCAKKYDLADIKVSEKYTMLCELPNLIEPTDVRKYENMLYVVEIGELPEKISALRGKFGLFFEYSLKSIDEIFVHLDKKVQTCVVYGINANEIAEGIQKMHSQGIDRIVPIGKSLDIGVVWDGYQVVEQLSRSVVL